MKRIVLMIMLIGGAILSTQAQGRRDFGRDNRGHGNGYGHSGPRYERVYHREVYRPAPRYYGGGYCAPAPAVVYYEAPCPPPPPRRVYYARGPRVVIAAGPVVVGF
jgi:hypothetical protein